MGDFGNKNNHVSPKCHWSWEQLSFTGRWDLKLEIITGRDEYPQSLQNGQGG